MYLAFTAASIEYQNKAIQGRYAFCTLPCLMHTAAAEKAKELLVALRARGCVEEFEPDPHTCEA